VATAPPGAALAAADGAAAREAPGRGGRVLLRICSFAAALCVGAWALLRVLVRAVVAAARVLPPSPPPVLLGAVPVVLVPLVVFAGDTAGEAGARQTPRWQTPELHWSLRVQAPPLCVSLQYVWAVVNIARPRAQQRTVSCGRTLLME